MANAAAATPTSAAQPAAPSLSVAPPHAATPLNMLTGKAANLATWEVAIALPRIEEHEYTWEGQTRKSIRFACVLVLVTDNTQYCMAGSSQNLSIQRTHARNGQGQVQRRAVLSHLQS